MQQHPVPQNVTSYQFRLIGEMTLKQFLELAGGGVIALLFYATNLPETLKWALIILSLFFGFALAFLPIEERPLDQWIIAFIKAIYRPTQYIWQKQSTIPAFFQYTPTAREADSTATSPTTNQNINQYLTSLPRDQDTETKDVKRIQSVLNLFTQEESFQPIQKSSAPIPSATPPPNQATSSQSTSTQATNNAPAGPTQRSSKKINTAPQEPVKVHQPKKTKKETTPQQKVIYQTPPAPTTTQKLKKKPGVAATTSNKLPFPSKPNTKNTVVGMVITPENKILENALIEIKNEEGVPVRATKTNQLGQFFSATPLKNGHYQIEVEKKGYNFDTIDLEVTGQLIEPLEIKAKET